MTDFIGRQVPDRVSAILLGIAVLMLVVRLATLGAYPLMDTSEARYGEIARVMLTTGNFVTPQEIPGTPFWAKPPLYAWLSVASIAILGTSEFALRLPSLLCAIGVLALGWSWSRSVAAPLGEDGAHRAAILGLAILSSSVLFFVSAGAVMTDPSLALCITALLVAFHHTVIAGNPALVWRWGFFVAAGLGMLAKGPVILLYAGAPIFFWMLWTRQFMAVWRTLPWIRGTALAALICVPWYLWAELRTPGFLQYFLLGEHVMRFLKPGWGGDLYGTAHAEPTAMIWLYFAGGLGVTFVLVVVATAGALRANLFAPEKRFALAPELVLPLLAVLVPLVFFTFAGNIIWTYVLPAMAPLAVLLGVYFAPRMQAAVSWRALVLGAVGLGAASVAMATIVWVPRHVARHSSAKLVAQWRERVALAPGELVCVCRKAPASLRYYTQGAVRTLVQMPEAVQGIAPDHDRYLALAPAQVSELEGLAADQRPTLTVQEVGRNEDLALLWVHAGAMPPPLQR